MLKRVFRGLEPCWADDNGNTWSCLRFSEEEAEEYSRTLINCNSCHNCRKCTMCSSCDNCTTCTRCKGCKNCMRCFDCRRCADCEGVSGHYEAYRKIA